MTLEAVDKIERYDSRELDIELNELVQRGREACGDGHEWLAVLILCDLGRCLWVGESVARLSADPVENLRLRCREFSRLLEFRARLLPPRWGTHWFTAEAPRQWASVEEHTHKLYTSLWLPFDDHTYFRETAELLRARMERNGISPARIEGKSCLDAGCGSGRYAVALKTLGAKDVVGLDLGVAALVDAQERLARAGMSGVSFKEGSVLDIPFSDGRFDFVMSNGVLHHTRDPLKGLQEMWRVMKPGGEGWLYLYNSDGLYWATRKAMRRIAAMIPEEVCRQVLQSLQLRPNRIFMYMDTIYVPIEENYTRAEVEAMLARAGFRSWTFLARGGDRDLSEAVARGDVGARAMYGEYGDLRFWVQK